ncbi:MAG: HTTM domain-containing protein [bacterium]
MDSGSLVAFRVAFGALTLIAVVRHLANGWVEQFFVVPRVFFPYPGLEWIVPLPAAGMYALYAGLALCALGILLGAWTRSSALLFCVGFTYVHLIDRTNYLNHYYLVTLISGLLAIVPAGAAGSIDAWRDVSRRSPMVPAWAVWLLRFQLGVVYAFGAVAKLNPDWLLRAEPLRIWLGASVDLPLLGPWLEQAWVAYAFSYAGLLFDAAIVPLLLWRRSRALAYGGVLAFHVLTAALFPIGMFPWLMIALTPIFFAPDWPRRALRWLVPSAAAPASESARAAMSVVAWPRSRRARGWLVAGLGMYAAVQIAVPLRHLAYGGDLYWSESGFRWAWQIMVMEKFGRALFTVVDPATKAAQLVRPFDELTPLQARMMATQPDMIMSYVRHLQQRFGDAVQIYADVTVTLNGRPAVPLVDPAVDLAALPDAAPLSAWLMPHPDAQRQFAAR